MGATRAQIQVKVEQGGLKLHTQHRGEPPQGHASPQSTIFPACCSAFHPDLVSTHRTNSCHVPRQKRECPRRGRGCCNCNHVPCGGFQAMQTQPASHMWAQAPPGAASIVGVKANGEHGTHLQPRGSWAALVQPVPRPWVRLFTGLIGIRVRQTRPLCSAPLEASEQAAKCF